MFHQLDNRTKYLYTQRFAIWYKDCLLMHAIEQDADALTHINHHDTVAMHSYLVWENSMMALKQKINTHYGEITGSVAKVLNERCKVSHVFEFMQSNALFHVAHYNRVFFEKRLLLLSDIAQIGNDYDNLEQLWGITLSIYSGARRIASQSNCEHQQIASEICDKAIDLAAHDLRIIDSHIRLQQFLLTLYGE